MPYLLDLRLKAGENVPVGTSYGATVIMEVVEDFEDRSIISAPEETEGEGRTLGLTKVTY
jgi:hypothetical protein